MTFQVNQIDAYNTMNEIILHYAELHSKERIFIGSSKGVVGYTDKRILQLANQVHSALKKLNIKKDDRVLIILQTSIEYVSSFFGTLLAGGIVVPLASQNIGANNLGYYLERIQHIIQNCNPKCIILDEIQFKPLEEMLDQFSHINVVNVNKLENSPEIPEYIIPDGDDICFIQYTSGSTGTPKGVPITHRNLISNIDSITRASLITEKDSCVSWLPLYHDMGLIGGFFVPFVRGIPLVLFPPELFIFKPFLWLKFLSDYKGTLGLGNNFALKYTMKRIKDEELKLLDLSSWRVAYNGSEPINMDVINDFYDKFKNAGYRAEAMFPCYGLAEATLAVTFPSPTEKPHSVRFSRDSIYEGQVVKVTTGYEKNSIELVAVGSPVPNMRVKIVDSDGSELEDGWVGEIIINGPSVMSGYFNHSSSEKEEYLKNDWFYTGDLGFFYENELFIAGRKKELIIIRGKNYSPVDIEKTIMDQLHNKISSCIAFGYMNPERKEEVLAIVYEAKKQDEGFVKEIKETIKRIVSNEFGIGVEDVIGTLKIPKTLNGKPMRSECYSKYILGQVL